jgi:translation initiation factor IF-2
MINYINYKNDKNEIILNLEKPKLFFKIKNDKEELKSSLLNNSIIEADDKQNKKNNAHNKYKQKEYNEEAIDLENKKNQIKKAGKRHKNISIDDEDDPIINSDIFQSTNIKNSPSIGYLLIRPPKPEVKLNLSEKKNNHNQNQEKINNSKKKKNKQNLEIVDKKDQPIEVLTPIRIIDFAALSKISEQEIIKFLFMRGIIATINQVIDVATAQLIANNFNIDIITKKENKLPELQPQIPSKINYKEATDKEKRPAIVTIMGHVDHGKTTLLDRIRNTDIAEHEAGNITQEISAHEVKVNINGKNETIIFLDTPGHEAFTSMRSRGALITDIAVLIIAADDGIKPQTIEAIKHLRAVNSPIIIAINKVDKETANINRVLEELTGYNLIAEELGGNTKVVQISALTDFNIDKLLESIVELANDLEINCNPQKKGVGTIIEGHLDKQKGPQATIIVQDGTLYTGDLIVCGTSYGRIRGMTNSKGQIIKSGTPSSIAIISGLSEVPKAGEKFIVVDKEKEARIISENNKQEIYKEHQLSSSRIVLSTLDMNKQINKIKKLDVILKTDTQGSQEAIVQMLSEIPQGKVQLQVINQNIGDITENDIELANTANATIITFNSKIIPSARNLASKYKTKIKNFNIIYDLLNEVENSMKDLVEIEYKEKRIGEAEVKNTFPLSKGTVAGCYVEEGKLEKDSKIKVLRNKQVIYEGELNSLKRIKEDINEIYQGNECGVVINDFHTWQKKDRILAYILEPQPASLN